MKKSAICSYCDKMFLQDDYPGDLYIEECLKHEMFEKHIEEKLYKDIKSYLISIQSDYDCELRLVPFEFRLINSRYFSFNIEILKDVEIINCNFFIDIYKKGNIDQRILVKFKMLHDDLEDIPMNKIKNAIKKKLYT